MKNWKKRENFILRLGIMAFNSGNPHKKSEFRKKPLLCGGE
jgi:hypothetical protein